MPQAHKSLNHRVAFPSWPKATKAARASKVAKVVAVKAGVVEKIAVIVKTKLRPGDWFLKSREWKAVRSVFLAVAPPVCVHCGAESDLQVDHILPRVHYPELALSISNLQVLCWKCNKAKGCVVAPNPQPGKLNA